MSLEVERILAAREMKDMMPGTGEAEARSAQTAASGGCGQKTC